MSLDRRIEKLERWKPTTAGRVWIPEPDEWARYHRGELDPPPGTRVVLPPKVEGAAS